MQENMDGTPIIETKLDRDIRKTKADALGYSLGQAINQRDSVMVGYVLGRADQGLEHGWSSDRKALQQIRDAACAYLDLFPELPPDPEPIARVTSSTEANVTSISGTVDAS